MIRVDTEDIGFRGQAPHDIFQNYMEQILAHLAYAGMPDARYDDGRIQWEAPSNRAAGKFKDSHHRRRQWWAEKAKELGIAVEGQWISRVAKTIHPTKKKPCKKCGKVMDIRYVYPRKPVINRLQALPFVNPEFEIKSNEDLFSLVGRLHDIYGSDILVELPALLKLKGDCPSSKAGLSEWLAWLEVEYVSLEPATLSPGAMSNAPDRLDGFHSFNRCCRSTADTGRSVTNLRSYTTDRRVFEYWATGDWIAADRLMGILRRDFREEPCLNGHAGPCQADHIGPISLGFNHRPHFQLLCGSCNGSKNNRMSTSDVTWLLKREALGEEVISWHSKKVWDSCKKKVTTQEEALRLSKVLRDNRHSYMSALAEISAQGRFAFLASLLELEHADFDVEFVDLRIVNHITDWKKILHTRRRTKYAAEQKARRSRIAFTELRTYFDKPTRNSFVVKTSESDEFLRLTILELEKFSHQSNVLDNAIRDTLNSDIEQTDRRFRQLYSEIDSIVFSHFTSARNLLQCHMDAVGAELALMWEDERFTRALLLP